MRTKGFKVTDEVGRVAASIAGETGEGFAITVAFELVDGAEAEFCRLARENATQSVALEAGCRRFDVLTAVLGSSAPAVLFYEIYQDRDAFATHVATEHYRQFDRRTGALVRAKTVLEFSVIENAKGD